ncbi:MAG: helicase-associated domain-containing protein, partial [Actinomycetota bacterium]|nr:helicase-associated domain-containing protein [Actinomycetota bacterium]
PALAQLDHPARLGPPLASVLAAQPVSGLSQLAARLGATPAPTKAATVAAITAVLADPVEVARLVEHGPPGTADLARRVADEGPLVNVRGGLYAADDRAPAGWLFNRGMLGIVDYYTAVMPREPAIALRGGRIFPPDALRRPDPAAASVDPGAVDRIAAERALQVVADVAAVLGRWAAEPPAILKAGGVGIRDVRKAAREIDRTEADTARIIELAAVAGLVRVDNHTGGVLPTAGYDEWTALDAPSRWARLAAGWAVADLHLSLAGAIGTKEKPIPPLLNRAPERDAARRRRLVLAILEAAPPGTAPDPGGVRDVAEWDGPAVWAGGPATARMLVSWVLEEADLLGVTALGALATAGRAVVAGRTEDAVAALAALSPPTVSQFVVQADLTAMIAGEPSPGLRSELDLMADVESKGAATVYRFSEASLRRAFDAGRTSDDVLAFLERHASRGVPQPLAYLVADLGRRFGNVRVGAVTSYLRSDDPVLLAEVLDGRRTARLRFRRLAPTVLVTDLDATTVTSTLRAAGYLPAQEGPDGALLRAQPDTRRLPVRSLPTLPTRDPPDITALVAALRRRPLPTTAPPTTAPPMRPARTPEPGLMPEPRLMEIDRPTLIAKDPRAIRGLLGEACEEYWVVRLSYVGDGGRSTELTVEPTDIEGRALYAACFPRGDERTFHVDRIEWVRVLTEAEEELLP